VINWDTDGSVWISSILSGPGVTSQVKKGLLVGSLSGSEDDGSPLAFNTVELEASDIDVQVRERNIPVVVVIKETDTIESVLSSDEDLSNEGTDVLRTVETA
jgi:hypothetical protein